MSRVQQLPVAIKKRLDELLVGGVPQKDILRQLEPLLIDAGEQPLSAAGLNRYATRMESLGRRIRESREVAEVWTAKFGEAPAGELGQHIINMLRTMAFEFTLSADGQTDDEGNPVINPTVINDLALAVQRMERAAEMSTRREKELRQAYAAKAETAARQRGISNDTAAAIRQAIEGAAT